MNRWIWIILAMLCVRVLPAQTPQEASNVFEAQAYAVSSENGEITENLVLAHITIHPADTNGGVTSVTLEINQAENALMVRVPRASLPLEIKNVLTGTSDIWLDMDSTNRELDLRKFDLTPDSSMGQSSKEGTVTVYNALGKPASGMKVEIYTGGHGNNPKIILQSTTLGADGKLDVSFPYSPLSPSTREKNYYTYRPFSGISIQTTDTSGQSQVLGFGSSSLFDPSKPDYKSVWLALVPPDAGTSDFRGSVVDDNGKALSNAKIRFKYLRFGGTNGKQFYGSIPEITTAGDGTFSVGVPQNFLKTHLGVDKTPTSSTLQVELTRITEASLEMGKENIIRLPYTEPLKFQLKDSNGKPMAGIKNNTVQMHMNRLREAADAIPTDGPFLEIDKKVIDPDNAIIDVGPVPLPGNYVLTVNDRLYKPQHLEKGASKSNIVWEMDARHATLKGRVLAAENNKPVSGAYVFSSFESSSAWKITHLSPDELESLWKRWSNGEIQKGMGVEKNVKLDNGETLSSVDGIAKTDANGAFTLDYKPGETPMALIAYIPGRIGASCRVLDLKKPDIAVTETVLADVNLPLAANVSLSAAAPDIVPAEFLDGDGSPGTAIKGSFTTTIDFDYTKGPWQSPLPEVNSENSGHWELILRSSWISPGQKIDISVPAGVTFSADISAPYKPTLGKAEWTNLGPLGPGATLVLPEKTVPVKIPFRVLVKKSDGTPAPGISVSIDGSAPQTTDKDGIMIGWSSGLVQSIRATKGNSRKVLAEQHKVKIVQSDTPMEVELVLKSD